MGERVYGGDLFTTDCSKGRHAWRVCFDEPGTPVKCKWCDQERYEDTDQHPAEGGSRAAGPMFPREEKAG